MNQAVKKVVIADPSAIAARRKDGSKIVQTVTIKDIEEKTKQLYHEHTLRKMRTHFN